MTLKEWMKLQWDNGGELSFEECWNAAWDECLTECYRKAKDAAPVMVLESEWMKGSKTTAELILKAILEGKS